MGVEMGAQAKPVLPPSAPRPPPPAHLPSHGDRRSSTDCPRWGLQGKVCSLCKTL